MSEFVNFGLGTRSTGRNTFFKKTLGGHVRSADLFIAEPGRLFAEDSTTLFCKVIGRRIEYHQGKDRERMIYLNDGVYGNLMSALTEPPIPCPYFVGSLSMDTLMQCVDGINRDRDFSSSPVSAL